MACVSHCRAVCNCGKKLQEKTTIASYQEYCHLELGFLIQFPKVSVVSSIYIHCVYVCLCGILCVLSAAAIVG